MARAGSTKECPPWPAIVTTIIVAKYSLPHTVFAYVDRIEDEFEAARTLACRLYHADQGYAYLYPGDPRLRMSAIRLLVPRD